jgi:hypothetical protein
MQAPRHIGIDLHRDKFTCCVRLENGRNYLTDWKLEDLPRFTKKLRPSDEIAVEVTGNTRLFRDAVAPHVARVVAVDPNQFQVISHSVKKTDPNDARNLALYLEKDLLPEVRMKDRTQAQLASLTQTRDTLVKLRTALKNKINDILSAHGINLSSEKKLNLGMKFDPMVKIELEVMVEEIRIGDRGHQRLRGRGQTGGVLRHCAAGVEIKRNRTHGADNQTRLQTGAHGPGAMRSDRAALQPISEAVLRKDQGAARDRQGDHCAGAQVTRDHLPNTQEQVGLRGFPELRIGGGLKWSGRNS